MKRASKPPTPPQPSVRDDPSRGGQARGGAPGPVGRPPPLPTAARNASPFAAAPPPPRAVEGPDPITEELERDELDTHRPAAPTIPFVPTPGVDWPTGPGVSMPG